MSNSGVNTAFAKCFILFMAVVILLQGTSYLGLSVWGIMLRKCSQESMDASSQPFQFAMDLIYFMNEDCGNPSIIVSGIDESITLDVDFNTAEPIENRTFIFMITYSVISTLWVVTSLATITALCGPFTKTIYGLCFWPWFLVIMAGSVLDIVATVYHAYDIINTTSVVKTFDYLSITANENIIKVLSNFDVYFITPAVVMTCISSRVILIWLLNIFGSSFCLSLSYTMSKRNSSKQNSVNSFHTTSTASLTSPQQQFWQEISPDQQPPRIIEQPKTGLPILKLQDVERELSIPPEADAGTRLHNVKPPTAPVVNMYPNAPSPNEPLSPQIHPDKLDSTLQSNISQYHQELSPISPLNNRYSTNNENFQFSMQNQRVSEELRGQLPWSYTSMPPAVPNKPQIQVYPKIPPPDYGQ